VFVCVSFVFPLALAYGLWGNSSSPLSRRNPLSLFALPSPSRVSFAAPPHH